MYDWLHSIVTSALDKVSGHLLAPMAPTKGSKVPPKWVNVSVLRTGQDPLEKRRKFCSCRQWNNISLGVQLGDRLSLPGSFKCPVLLW